MQPQNSTSSLRTQGVVRSTTESSSPATRGGDRRAIERRAQQAQRLSVRGVVALVAQPPVVIVHIRPRSVVVKTMLKPGMRVASAKAVSV